MFLFFCLLLNYFVFSATEWRCLVSYCCWILCCDLLWINDKGKRGWYVTLCRWPAKQTIPLSVLERNQRSRRDWKWKGTREESELGKGAGRGSWRRRTDRGSRHWTPERRGQSAGDRVQTSERRLSRHSICFVEVSLVTHASVSLHMHKVLHNSPSALELTPSVCSLFSFLSLPWLYSCCGKKCALPQSGPLVDHRP